MNRGSTTFICIECGNIFEDEIYEWNHTCIIAPAECSKCRGRHTMPYNRDFSDYLEDLDYYSNVIWKRHDELRNNEENDDDICSILKSL